MVAVVWSEAHLTCSLFKLNNMEKGTFYFFVSVRGRPRGRSVNFRPMCRAVVVLVKHILPRFRTWQQIPPMEAHAVLGIAPCYHKSRSGSQQTVTKKKNVPFSDPSSIPRSRNLYGATDYTLIVWTLRTTTSDLLIVRSLHFIPAYRTRDVPAVEAMIRVCRTFSFFAALPMFPTRFSSHCSPPIASQQLSENAIQ